MRKISRLETATKYQARASSATKNAYDVLIGEYALPD